MDDIKIALLEQDIELEEASLPAKKESWRKEVEKMVERCGGNKKLAAQLLGVHVSTVYRALEDAN